MIFYDGVNDTHVGAARKARPASRPTSGTAGAEFNIRQSPARLAAALIAKLVEDSASYRFAQVIGRRLAGDSRRDGTAAVRGSTVSELVAGGRPTISGQPAIVEQLGRGFGFEPLFYWQPVVFDKATLTPYEREEAAKFAWTEDSSARSTRDPGTRRAASRSGGSTT